jgi:5'-3' exonuclease
VVYDALPAAHALTGCDSTNSLFKIGKKTAFAKLIKHAEELPALASFGIIQNLEENVSAARKYALALYGNKRRSTQTSQHLHFHPQMMLSSNMYFESCSQWMDCRQGQLQNSDAYFLQKGCSTSGGQRFETSILCG